MSEFARPVRRCLPLLALTALLAAGAPTGAAADPAGCGQGSWVAGTVDLCDGEIVYRDYVYDDLGAGFRPFAFGQSSPYGPWGSQPEDQELDAYGGLPPAGVATWGPDRERDNLADLVALRISLSGGQLSITAELNTMFFPGVTDVVVGIDTDDNLATRAGATWPGLVANHNATPLVPLTNNGLDLFVTLSGGDPETNLLTATLPAPGGNRWRFQAVTAEADTGIVRNAAFRGPGETGYWWDQLQADALARGDIGAFSYTVEVSRLAGGATQRADTPPGRVYQRVYISEYNPGIGEGIDNRGVPGSGYGDNPPAPQFVQKFHFLGPYQPYGFYQPAKAGPHGLQLGLHGLTANHSQFVWLPSGPTGYNAEFGEGLNRIIAVPLGRGPSGFYSSYSERDVLDVGADVKANYDIDEDRVFISGVSMGGYGAMRLGALYPDLFAGVVNWVGFSGDIFNGTPMDGMWADYGSGGGGVGNVRDLLRNLEHVPMAALYGAADELIHVWTAYAIRDELARQEIPSVHYVHTAEHLTFNVLDYWHKEAQWTAGLQLVREPSRFRYRTDRRFYFPELGIVPDGAYWTSGIVPRGPGYADIEAASEGCGLRERATQTATSVGWDPVPWEAQEVAVSGVEVHPPQARLDLTLSNVASVLVETGDAAGGAQPCLGADAFDFVIRTDGSVVISFSDGRKLQLTGSGVHTGTLEAEPSSG